MGVLAVLLAVFNGVLFSTNQAAQAELRQKQDFLQQTGQLEGIYNNIATSLAQLAVRDNDRVVIDMLGGLGLSVAPQPVGSAPASDLGVGSNK